VLQAPPTHQDVFPDIGATNAVTVDLNIPDPSCLNFYDPNLCAAVGYITQQKVTTDQTVGYKRTWSVAANASVDIASVVNLSLTTTYGKDFQDTTQTITTQSTQSGVLAMTDDAVLYSETDSHLWEYAVFSPGSPNQAPTYLAIIWPDVSCSTAGGC